MEKRKALEEQSVIVLNQEGETAAQRFIVNGLIGSGGSCLVYSVHRLRKDADVPMGRQLALKECFPVSSGAFRRDDQSVSFPDDDTKDSCLRMFTDTDDRENRFYDLLDAKQIISPAVTILYGNGTVYRLFNDEGGNDLQYVRNNAKNAGFSNMEAVSIMLSLCSAAGRLHEKGYLYLDYKPENIYLKTDDAPHVYLFDFDGVISKKEVMEEPERISYTFQWAPPELYPYADTERISERTDIYELGEVYYWLLTGAKPAEKDKADSFADRKEEIRKGNPFNVSEKINDQIIYILEKTLQEDPANRFAGTAELKEQLVILKGMLETDKDNPAMYDVITEIGGAAQKQAEQLGQLSKNQKTNRKLLLVLIAAVLLAAGVGIHYAMSGKEQAADPAVETGGKIELPGYTEEIDEYNTENGYASKSSYITLEASLRRAPEYRETILSDDEEQLRFRIHYVNYSGEKKENIHIRCIFPPAIEYEKGSTKLYNTTNPDGLQVSDNLFTDTGMNIGGYNDGGGAWIYFNAAVNKEKVEDGNTIFRNIVQVSDGNGTVENKADVVISKSSALTTKAYIGRYSGDKWRKEVSVEPGDEFTVFMFTDNDSDERFAGTLMYAGIPEGLEFVPGSAAVSYLDKQGKKVTESISDRLVTEGYEIKSLNPHSNLYVTYKVKAGEDLERGSRYTIGSVFSTDTQTFHSNVYVYIND